MFCTTGGGQSNGSRDLHTWFVGSAVTLSQSRNRKIGSPTWGTGVSNNGNVSISLPFQLDAGPASIGATVGVTPGVGTYTGDISSDGRFPHDPNSGAWNANRVNTFFVSPHTWPWDGTSNYEGNDSEVLYEWPMGTTGTFNYLTYSYLANFCTLPAPANC